MKLVVGIYLCTVVGFVSTLKCHHKLQSNTVKSHTTLEQQCTGERDHGISRLLNFIIRFLLIKQKIKFGGNKYL